MAEAHCKFIDLGVESFNQEILDYVKKDIDVKKNEEAIKLVKNMGYLPRSILCLGHHRLRQWIPLKEYGRG